MHDPYEWHQILKLSNQIDSFAAYDNYLIVGTRQGHLIMYNIEQQSDVQLLRYHKNFYRKAIQQLDVIPQLNILIILTDNSVYVHDVSSMNFPLVSDLKKTKGASLFAIDVKIVTVEVENQSDESITSKESYIVRLCVAVKRKLQLYYWKNNHFEDFKEDITVSDIPKSIALSQQSICVGYKGEYALIKLNETPVQEKELFPTSTPNVIKLTESMFALIKETQTVFVDMKGDVFAQNAVKWSETPVALAYDEPYLIALLSETIEVRSMQPALLVQTIKIEKSQLICNPCSGTLYVSTGMNVHRIVAMPAARQIQLLLEEKQFQLALKLCNVSNDSEAEKIKSRFQIQKLYAYDLFNNKQYHDAMKQFLELDTDPYDVIRLFPNLLPQKCSFDDATSSDNQLMKASNRDTEKSYPALIEYLTGARAKVIKNEKGKNDKEMNNALQMIDTTLLRCYLYTNDALVAPLIRLKNCHMEDSEFILKKHKKYAELVILYETKGLHRRALELLQKQADQPDSTKRDVERMIQYLQRLGRDHVDLILQFSGWILDNHPDEGLRVFIDDITEVEQLPRPKVMDYLIRTKQSLVIPYLEHLIHVWNDTNTILHNALANQYREKILATSNSTNSPSSNGQKMRTKLINFLEKSKYYDAGPVLALFPYDGLYEEKAILSGKLGQHKQVLGIYVNILGNIEKAVEYCNQVYKTGGESASLVYVYLLETLINQPNESILKVPCNSSWKPDIEMALTLLEGNALRIPPEKALKILPKNIPISRIKHYLTTSLREHLHQKRNSQILRGLLYAEHLQMQEMRIRFESQNILLTELNICPVCKKRFSNQSAFIRNPNGDIIHVSCQSQEDSKTS